MRETEAVDVRVVEKVFVEVKVLSGVGVPADVEE